MRVVRPSTDLIWESGDYTGDQRPMGRVTVQVARINPYPVGKGRWNTALFGAQGSEVELPNVRSINIDRRTDQDAATCEIVFYNQKALPIGEKPKGKNLDQPGYYTPNRGKSVLSSRWGHTTNEWSDMLAPNRILRTYQGYGLNAAVRPQEDEHLDQTGTWLIDSVVINSDKSLTVRCRDLAKILIEEICHPPVIPLSQYPVSFSAIRPVAGVSLPTATGNAFQGDGSIPGAPKKPASSTTTDYQVVNHKTTYRKSSNDVYVGNTGSVYGHTGAHAFDTSDATYWLSVGNPTQNGGASTEYIEATLGNVELGYVKFYPKGGNYQAWLSIYADGAWLGSNVVPYDKFNPSAFGGGAGPGNGADIPYYKAITVGQEGHYIITLPKSIKKVTRIRLSFRNLQKIGSVPKYRAGVRSMSAHLVKQTQTTTPVGTGIPGSGGGAPTVTAAGQGGDTGTPGALGANKREGNYEDYTQIVKYFCALGGFYWPADATPKPPVGYDDEVVGVGRIWGDMEDTGTYGPNELPASLFDKKPLMDAITYVRDIVSFVFFVDELGAVVFRSPNIWQIGNYIATNVRQIEKPAITSQGSADPLLSSMGPTAGVSPINAPATGGSSIVVEQDVSTAAVNAAVAAGNLPAEALVTVNYTGGGATPSTTTVVRGVTQYLLDRFDRKDDSYIRQADTGHIWKQTGPALLVAGTDVRWAVVTNAARRRYNDANGGEGQKLWFFAELNATHQKARGVLRMNSTTRSHRKANIGLRFNTVNCVEVELVAPQTAGGPGAINVYTNLSGTRTLRTKRHTTLIKDVQAQSLDVTCEINRDTLVVSFGDKEVLRYTSTTLSNVNFGQAIAFGSEWSSTIFTAVSGQSIGLTTDVAIPPVPVGGLQDLADGKNGQYLTTFDTGQSWVHVGEDKTAPGTKYHRYAGDRIVREGDTQNSAVRSIGNLVSVDQDVTTVVGFTTGGFGNYGYVLLRSNAAATSFIQVTVHTGKALPGDSRSGSVEIGTYLNGTYTKVQETVFAIADTGFKVRAIAVGDEVTVFINNVLALQYLDGFDPLVSRKFTGFTGQYCGIQSFVSGITYDGFRATRVGSDAGGSTANDYVPDVSDVIDIPRIPLRLERSTSVRTLDERKHIKGITVTLDDKNQRSRIFIANQNSDVGAVVSGRDPYPMGLERVAIWTDQHFQDQTECLVMADLIALQYRFKQRTASVVIPGNPAFQPDDQVRIFEEVTAETNYHYVVGVNSRMDLDRGVWDMSLDTHWLGESPLEGGSWAFDRSNLEPETQEYLTALGKLPPVTTGVVTSVSDPNVTVPNP